jgi:hypothetical protein
MPNIEEKIADFKLRFVISGWLNERIHFEQVEKWLRSALVCEENNDTSPLPTASQVPPAPKRKGRPRTKIEPAIA